MSAAALVERLAAWAGEELAFQTRLSDALDGVEGALRAGRRAPLEERLRELDELLAAEERGAARRSEIRAACGRIAGVPAARASLTPVLERAAAEGAPVDTLERLRGELRGRVAGVAERARRLAILVRHHRGVLGELAGLLGVEGARNDDDARGILMDAEA